MKDKPVILVVDDQLQNNELLEAYLIPEGYEIVKAANGEEALAKLSGNPIDLILLDVMMPDMDGFEVTRRVRQDVKTRLLPIILVTALRETEDRVKGIEAGCDDFISKPVDKMELLARVRSLLKVKAYNDLLSNYQKELEAELTKKTEELKHSVETLQQDIEKQKQAAAGARRLAAIVEDSNDAITTQDMNGQIVTWNRGAEHMYGYSPTEAIGMNVTFLLPEEDHGLVPQFLEDTKNRKGVASPEVKRKTKDGRIINVWLTVTKLVDDEGRTVGIATTERDITELKKTEELGRSNRELEQFAYVASHDLREPLRMINSFTKLLAERYQGKLDKDADEFIGFILEGAARMHLMISELLDYSRVGTQGKPFELTDFEDVLRQATANLATVIVEKKAAVTHDPLPMLMTDQIQVVRLFQNLIDNAIKFHGEDSPTVHISAKKAETDWVFSVRDNGLGIAPESLDKLFVVFQRLHSREKYPGVGIGLATCKKIVERHGGRIWVESELGTGSTFYFTIPAGNIGK
jgi:PAS domain S-box-containing protein